MAQWEIIKIEVSSWERKTGIFSKEKVYKAQAIMQTSAGSQMVLESKVGNYSTTIHRELAHKLALDGWEPITYDDYNNPVVMRRQLDDINQSVRNKGSVRNIDKFPYSLAVMKIIFEIYIRDLSDLHVRIENEIYFLEREQKTNPGVNNFLNNVVRIQLKRLEQIQLSIEGILDTIDNGYGRYSYSAVESTTFLTQWASELSLIQKELSEGFEKWNSRDGKRIIEETEGMVRDMKIWVRKIREKSSSSQIDY